ncbi:hypothetical protein FRC00_012425, partial [Tulasnella sp. 408]
MTALKDEGNKARTWNNAPAHASTLNPVLDAFSTIDGNTPGDQVHQLLRESWAESPEKTLRVIWNLRSIHDGKAAKMNFYRAFGWLYSNHPKTAIDNLQLLVDQVIEQKPKPKKEDKDKKESDKMDDESEWTAVDSDSPEKEALQPSGLSHGYYKDLLNILLLAYSNQLTSPIQNFTALESPRPNHTKQNGTFASRRRKKRQADKAEKRKEEGGKDAYAKETAEKVTADQAKASKDAQEARSKQASEDHQKLVDKLKTDPAFKALYIAVSRIFAASLEADVKTLREVAKTESKEERHRLRRKLTMAAKWAPTVQCSHDRRTNIATGIALAMYSNGALEGLNKQLRIDAEVTEEDAKLLRSFVRRWIVSPLRRYEEVVEGKMSAGDWNKVIYTQVPSLSFSRNKEHFFKHDENRLASYLQAVMSGKKTISGAALMPHELVYEAIRLAPTKKDTIEAKLAETNMQIISAQWNTLVEKTREGGKLANCLAVCDVSGSMGSIEEAKGQKNGLKQTDRVSPIFPSIGLSLLLAQLASPPFANSFITFSQRPEIVTLSSTASFAELVREIESSSWGMNTDFDAVFSKLILPMAVKHKIPKEDMVKKLFVFSDMQFDEARTTNEWETNHQKIVREFEEAGYEVPEIVYWNLQGVVGAKPVTKDTPGVAMLSGFSGNMLKLFMEGADELEEAEEEKPEDKIEEEEKEDGWSE